MSKIFDALQNTGENLIDPALAALIQDCAQQSGPQAGEPAAQQTATQAGVPAAQLPAPQAGVPPAHQPAPQAGVPAAHHLAPQAGLPAAHQPAPFSTPAEPAPLSVEFAARRVCPMRIPDSAPLLPFGDLDFAAGEQYRIVRTRIIQHPRHPRTIVISSGGGRDGKTVTAINLAGALSLKADGKVLLVDGDLRRSNIHLLLGLPEGPGLAEVLRGTCPAEEAWIQIEQFPSLCVLPAGTAKSSPAELFDSSRWPAVCAGLRRSFQYVIVDSPPIAAVADYDLIQAACDGIILVLRLDHTTRKLAFKAVESVPKERLIGVVLNHVDDWFLNPSPSPYRYARHAP